MANFKDILDPEQPQVLIDLETMSTRTDAAICSIGATKFTLAEGIIDKFYINVDLLVCKSYGLHFMRDTIDWWKKQDPEISNAWKEDPVDLKTALTDFYKWYGPKSMPTWGNSPRFDIMILENAFAVTNLAPPWVFRDECCFRTLMKMIPVEIEHYGRKHHALDDAIGETMALIKALKG